MLSASVSVCQGECVRESVCQSECVGESVCEGGCMLVSESEYDLVRESCTYLVYVRMVSLLCFLL